MLTNVRSHETLPDSLQYVEKWARDIVAVVGKREARRLLEDYRTIASNRRLPATDRENAIQRVNCLEKLL